MPNACSMHYALICVYQDTYHYLLGFPGDFLADAQNHERLGGVLGAHQEHSHHGGSDMQNQIQGQL